RIDGTPHAGRVRRRPSSAHRQAPAGQRTKWQQALAPRYDAENLRRPREVPAQTLECAMQTLHPEIKPYARHELAVEAPHVLYVDESGSPDGLPVLFVHGGPGGGCDALSRRFFDPNLYRI